MKSRIANIIGQLGVVAHFSESEGKVAVSVELNGKGAPLKKSLKRAVEEVVVEYGKSPEVTFLDAKVRETQEPKYNGTSEVKRVLIVASGKGGVGKSTVAAQIARSLVSAGQRVGVLDADIYGPSQPKLFGVESEKPYAANNDMIIPPMSKEGIKVNSIGFFVESTDALVWRGPMATTALKQLIHQSAWGELDTLVVDLPPGTGDIHLTVAAELNIDGAIIVTTPSDLALSDVIRGVAMLKNENIAVPILGVINNMAYFSPEDNPTKKYYIFGDDTRLREVAEEHSLKIIGEVPIGGDLIFNQLI